MGKGAGEVRMEEPIVAVEEEEVQVECGADQDLTKGMEMFSARLLRKAYRPNRRGPSCPPDVEECEAAFMKVLRHVAEKQPHTRGEWYNTCNTFSDKWDHVCHWIHPTRLADFLSEELGFKWVGEPPPRKETAERQPRAAVRAQKFHCPACGVTCNSYAQYEIHAQGARHKDVIAQRQRAAQAQGGDFSDNGPVPLGEGQAEVTVDAAQLSYYRRASDENKDDDEFAESKSGSRGSRTPPSSPKPRSPRSVVPLAMAMVASAMSGNAAGASQFNSAGTSAGGWYEDAPNTWAYGNWNDGYCGIGFAAAWDGHQCPADSFDSPNCLSVDDDDEEEEGEGKADGEKRLKIPTGSTSTPRSSPRCSTGSSNWADDEDLPHVASPAPALNPRAASFLPRSVRPTQTPPLSASEDWYTVDELYGGYPDSVQETYPYPCDSVYPTWGWHDGIGSCTESTLVYNTESDAESSGWPRQRSVASPTYQRYHAHEGIERGLLGGESAQDEVLKAVSEEGVEVA
eukprot:Hpha_TRINITY_DN16332_c2_g7::TRINITY_DN16332_c2_g7_i1::g.60902::m.60902